MLCSSESAGFPLVGKSEQDNALSRSSASVLKPGRRQMTACKELNGQSDINDSPNRRDGCTVGGKLHFLFSNLRKQHADVDGGSRAGIAVRMFVAGVAGTGRAECQQAQRKDAKRICGVRFAGLA